eukprot:TRINITY_DN1081_c0_g1_i1.p1 TRINITY_DN1081_c0_g1~~TRINITY_DN1081_c0_g1_i1.p1  ORF type:complete len:132 (+),score=42.01 TRINITY_DN1081_c0_g1_i1:63-458(+)
MRVALLFCILFVCFSGAFARGRLAEESEEMVQQVARRAGERTRSGIMVDNGMNMVHDASHLIRRTTNQNEVQVVNKDEATNLLETKVTVHFKSKNKYYSRRSRVPLSRRATRRRSPNRRHIYAQRARYTHN